jgi:hypothetical protein
MGLKGQDHCFTLAVFGQLDKPLDDRLMTEVEAVVVTNGHDRRGKILFGKGEVIDNPHGETFRYP